MTTPRIYTDLSADERTTAHAAYRRITGQCIDPGFAPDRAWVEGWIAACAERSAPPRPSDDALWDQTLKERDSYQEWADKLAAAIAKHLGVEIGEHSNMNNPWAEILDAIEMTPAEILSARLLDAWCASHGKQIPWAKAIEISAVVCKMSDEEKQRLLFLDEPIPSTDGGGAS